MTPPKHFQPAFEFHQQGRLAEAEAAYREGLRVDPISPDGWHMLGLVVAQQGRLDEGVKLVEQSMGMGGDRADIRCNLGELYRKQGKLPDALASLEKAVLWQPRLAEAHFNLGNVLKELNRHADAIASYERCVSLVPQHAPAHFNLANTLREEGKLRSAVREYHTALTLKPVWWEAHLNLGNALYDLRELAGAIQHYTLALPTAPPNGDIEESIGHAHMAAGDTDAARHWYRQGLMRQPNRWLRALRVEVMADPIPASDAAIDAYRTHVAATVERVASQRLIAPLAELHSSGAEPPMALAYHGRDDLPLKRQYAAMFAAALPHVEPPPRSGGKPRIGFVVTHGHEGVFARCLGSTVSRLPLDRFDPYIVCCRSGANVLRHMLSHESLRCFVIPDTVPEAAAALRSARFDLLQYWEIGTDSMNYFLPFFRPARLQINSWGWPVSSGNPCVDAYLSSDWLEPDNGESHYSERLVKLPTLPTYYLRPPVPSELPMRSQFGVQAGERFYLCVQNLRKWQPGFDAIARQILDRDPQGRLVVLADEQPKITERFMQRFLNGRDDLRTRVTPLPRMEREDYLGAVRAADVVLDTPHYGGGANTVFDAVAAGAPTVTLPGAYHRSRWAAGVFRRLGLPQLVADDAEGYVNIALRLAADADERRAISRQLTERAGELFADGRVIAAFTAAYEQLLE